MNQLQTKPHQFANWSQSLQATALWLSLEEGEQKIQIKPKLVHADFYHKFWSYFLYQDKYELLEAQLHLLARLCKVLLNSLLWAATVVCYRVTIELLLRLWFTHQKMMVILVLMRLYSVLRTLNWTLLYDHVTLNFSLLCLLMLERTDLFWIISVTHL